MFRLGPWQSILVGLTIVFTPIPSSAEDPATQTWWTGPETGTIGIGVFSGYGGGSDLNGALLGGKLQFYFRNFIGGLTGSTLFDDTGTAYAVHVDIGARWNCVVAGADFGIQFIPGASSRPYPAFGGHAGVQIPLLRNRLWLFLEYRPVAFVRSEQVYLYHEGLVGILIGSGT